jgi:8-oxo-dGTP pyrophosphatase MutT (NUDIX family)
MTDDAPAPIPPALDERAWKEVAASNSLPYAYGSSILDDLSWLDGDDIPAAIAYLNTQLPDDDLRKITWARIDEALKAVDFFDDNFSDADRSPLWIRALASYLPPR